MKHHHFLPLLLTLACSTMGTDDADAKTSAGASKSGQTKSGETKAGETKAGETKSGETKSGETKSGQTKAGETKSGETTSEKDATTMADAALPPAPAVDEEARRHAGQSIDRFAMDLYHVVASDPGNLAMSPASIGIALGMTFAGARGTTQKELASALHQGDSTLSPAAWHAATGGLVSHWNGISEKKRPEWAPPIELAVANRLFGDRGVVFHDAFLEQSARDYRAPLEQLDFRGASEDARGRINGWVEDQTREKIKDLIPSGGVNGGTRLVLVNAIYFKGQWVHTFSEGATKPAPFHVDGAKSTTDVPMMAATNHYAHAHIAADGLSVIELPYESGPFAMNVLLPDAVDGIGAVEKALSAEKLEAWLGAAKHARVALKLPKFEIDPPESMRLADALGTLGVVDAFTPGKGDFTGMADAKEQLILSEVFHKAFVAVDEKGTVAAAATAVGMRAGSAPPTAEPIPFDVDRPFLFLIRDTQSGVILFIGRVTQPSS